MHFKTFLWVSGLSILIFGCGSGNDVPKAARSYCIDQNGTIERFSDANNVEQEYCVTEQSGVFDEGELTYTLTCPLEAFYNDTCEAEAETEISAMDELTTVSMTQNQNYYNRVDHILRNVSNTGYTHRPFLLHPNINESNATYDLFLDCSGFVGYYVLQQQTPLLYEALPRNYSCGPLDIEDNVSTAPARPLAADFVEYFKNLTQTATGCNDLEANATSQCWGRVEHIQDARPGDVIAYLHEENIDRSKQYCCQKIKYNDDSSCYYYSSATLIDSEHSCNSGRAISKTFDHKSTGHVMFIIKAPYLSSKYKDDDGQSQWVVKVADSTNVHHTSDSRKVQNDGGANYKGHAYHSWTAGVLEHCKDGSYHRHCDEHNSTMVESVEVTGSSEADHPTGIGAGYIYVNNHMDGYRVRASSRTSKASIYIGRPIRCE
jgi:hypothetical protein